MPHNFITEVVRSNALNCRYRFWADYEGEGDEGLGVAGSAAGSPGSGGKHRRRSKKGFAPEASPGREDGEPQAQRHDGGGGGGHHRLHHPSSARRGGGAAAAGGGPTGNAARAAYGQQQQPLPSEAVSGAVQRALAGVGNNVTAPAMVRQVDKANMQCTMLG